MVYHLNFFFPFLLDIKITNIKYEKSQNIYEEKPTKSVIVNRLSLLKLNEKFKFYIKPSQPIAELKYWNDIDNDNCYRFELKCGK